MADFIGFPLNTWIFSLCCRNYSLLCVIWGSCPHAVCRERNMPGCLADWLPECPVVRGPRPWSPPLLVMCVRKVVTHIWQKSQVPHAARLQVVLRPLSSVLVACAMTVIALFFLLLYLCLSGFPLLGLRASLDPTRSLKPTAIPFFLLPCPVLLWLIWPWLCSPWQVPLELATVFSGAAMEVFYVWNNNSYLNVVQPFLKCHYKFSLKHYYKSISLFLFATHLFCSWLWFWFTTSFLSRHSWSLCFRPSSMTMSWFFVSMSDMNVMESSKRAHTHTK